MGRKFKKPFNDQPFAYHQEIELEISTLTNLGLGLGRIPIDTPALGENEASRIDVPVPTAGSGSSSLVSPTSSDASPRPAGWVVMVPFTLPGERVRVRVFRNHKNFSEADLVEVLRPSPERVTPRCPLFGRCGGCQYQHLNYAGQLRWKQQQVAELLLHMAGIAFAVAPVIASPREYGYRSKITPHFAAPRFLARGVAGSGLNDEASTASPSQPAGEDEGQEGGTPSAAPTTIGAASGGSMAAFPIGFLRQGTRFDIVDVPQCPIATPAINSRLIAVREAVQAKAASYMRGATLLLREASGEVTTDYDAVITETIEARAVSSLRSEAVSPLSPALGSARPAPIRLHFLARDFFQNNPFILGAFTGYVREQAAASGARFLVDAYCGSGLFALTAASAFERVAGVEISESSVRFAKENAAANGITNATFLAADAREIFAGLEFPAADTAVIIDPPRKGCEEPFLRQLFAYGPRAVVYVSCDPATQMRDLKFFLEAGYKLKAAQPFDLFPQTRHLECVLTLTKAS